jgi:sugar O-acyltransferase (sialic acid O-acetyltransferase NeuD family)
LTPLWSNIYFVDDCTDESTVHGLNVFRFEAMISHKHSYQCVIALGEPSSRQNLHQKLMDHEVQLATIIDPLTTISNSANIGAGCVIGPGSFISCNTHIGKNTLVEINCVIGHDILIGAHSVISSCSVLGGRSSIGHTSFIGMNTTVRDRVHVGDRSIISMAAAVFNDIPDDVIALGNPARVMRKNEEHRVFQ